MLNDPPRRPGRPRKIPPDINGTAGAEPTVPKQLTEDEAAAILNCRPSALQEARRTGIGAYAGLKWIKYGSARSGPIRYEMPELARFVAAARRQHEPEAD